MKHLKLMFVWLGLLVFLMGCGDTESQAKKDVEQFLEWMKTGNVDRAEDYLDLYTDNFIDVFAYTYLNTLEEEELQREFEISKLSFNNSDYMKEEYGTWEEYVKHIQTTYAGEKDHVEYDESFETIKQWTEGDTYMEYVFLYDMEIANGIGNKIYKKVEITTAYDTLRWNSEKEDFEEGFIITDIEIR